MNDPHSQLSETIKKIWREDLSKDYDEGRVNSERAIQACFYYHLRNAPLFQDKDKDYEIFIESNFTKASLPEQQAESVQQAECLGRTRYAPDIMISYERKIIGIIEIKNSSETKAIKKDLTKFDKYKECSKSPGIDVRLSVDPKTGYYTDVRYKLLEDFDCYFVVIFNALDIEKQIENLLIENCTNVGKINILARIVDRKKKNKPPKDFEHMEMFVAKNNNLSKS